MVKFKKNPASEPSEAAASPAAAKPRKSKSVSKSGGKGKQFVLLIGDDGAILVFMEGKKVVRRLFAPSPQPDSTEAMLELMRANANVPISILVDSIDQQFVRQSFPPVSSVSVKGLVNRRLERDFQPEDLKGFLPLGREKIGRKEWQFLLISLAKTTLLTSWIDLVAELANPLLGIYLVPVEASTYIAMLNRASNNTSPQPWQFLVTHHKISGFRQVVLQDGRLVFTRLTQIVDDAIPAVIAGNVEQEVLNTLEYLKRLGFADNKTLDLTIVASQDVNEALDLNRFGFAATQALAPIDVADALGFEQAALSADRFGDVVMAAAFLRGKKRVLRFATAYINALSQLYAVRKAITLLSALVVLGLAGMSISNLLDMNDINNLTDQSITKHNTVRPQLQHLKETVANLDKNIAFKSAVVSTYNAYIKNAPEPITFIKDIAPLLTPDERILSLEWTTKADAPQGTSTPPKTADSTTPITVTAEFIFRGTYKDVDALSKAVAAYIAELTRKLPQYTITSAPFPWISTETKSLEISFDKAEDGGIKEEFTHIKLTFTPAAAKTKKAGGAP